MRGAIIAALVAVAGGAAAEPNGFAFEPLPRWAEDPETDIVCEAVRAECAGVLKDGGIDAEWTYDEVYDADGVLVGLRSVTSTGCKPLDEHLLLSQRHFVKAFTSPGQPDLDRIRAEVAPGTSKDAVRLLKRGTSSVVIGC